MKKHKTLGSTLSMLTASALPPSLCVIPSTTADSAAASAAVFENTNGDGGSNDISLSAEWTFQASVPVDMTEVEAKEAASSVTWTLTSDVDAPDYLGDTQLPNQTEGGPLSVWLYQDGETPFSTDVATAAETADGQVYLTATFTNQCYLGDDLSVPHSNGGSYVDVCGYFTLSAGLDGKTLGSVDLKVASYDNFRTMSEVYDELDTLVDYAAGHTDLYMEQFSMGQSQGSNGLESLDMPYPTVAKDKAAVDKWQEIKAEAESDPTALLKKLESGALGGYQVLVMYSNTHANEVAASDGTLAFAWMLVETAAPESGTIDYDRLIGFTVAGRAELVEQMGPVGEKSSMAVPDLATDDVIYLGYTKGENVDGTIVFIFTQVELEKYYTIGTVTVDTDELFSDVLLITAPEENVEGRIYPTCTSSGDFSLNRDNPFQTQAETQNMARLIVEWNPVSLTEFHGRVQVLQCEPYDPPHEPNFEYDLPAKHLMGGGEVLGTAVVANNGGHNSYVIPQWDYLTYTGAKTTDGDDQTQWLNPWDDMSTGYIPQYTMLHGIVSYIAEVPAYDNYMVQGVAYGQLGQSVYTAEHKDGYLTSQTKIFKRGVTNANSDAHELVGQWFCDQYDVEGVEADLFRPEYDGGGQNGNFYPECYITPMDGVHQSNLQAATEMMEYLTHSGIQVSLTDQSLTHNGVEYPVGTLIVSMHQAKWSMASGVLYDGTVTTDWPVLYFEGITAFDKVRGFDMVVCAEPAAYKTISAVYGDVLDYEEALDYVAPLTSFLSGVKDTQVVSMNASEDSTAAASAPLKAGKSVSPITKGQYEGSFLVSYADWQSVADDYLFPGVGVTDALVVLAIPRIPVVYISGKSAGNDKGFVKTTLVSGSYEYNYSRQAMRTLGFTVTDDASQADLIIGAAALDEQALAAAKNGTLYIGHGSKVMESAVSLLDEGAPVRETVSPNTVDTPAYVTYPTDSLITTSYVVEGGDFLYGYGTGYFAAILAGARVLVQLDGPKELLEGFFPVDGERFGDFLDDSIQTIPYQGAGADNVQLDVVFFTNTLTNKTDQRDEYDFTPNTVWAAVLDGTGCSDVAPDVWYAEAVAVVTGQGLMNGVISEAFGPGVTAIRGMLVTVLHCMVDEPAASASAGLADVAAGSYCVAAVDWAYEVGITSGAGSTGLTPDSALIREQAVTLLYNYAEVQGLGVSAAANLPDYPGASAVSALAQDAVAQAVDAELLIGTGVGTLNPQGTATRAELVVLPVRAKALSTTE